MSQSIEVTESAGTVWCANCDVRVTLESGADIPSGRCAECGATAKATDRSLWSERARAGYAGIEEVAEASMRFLSSPYTVQLIESAGSMPATWWQHAKWSLKRRWPRMLGWLDVRWTNRVPR